MRNQKAVLIGFGLVMLGVGSFFVYKRSVIQDEQAAQKFFAECIEEYGRIMQEKGGDWAAVEKAFAVGFERHKKATLAPHFLAFQAEALVRQNKLPEAVALMDKVIQSFSPNSPLYGLFATKRALMKIDSADELAHDAGLQELTQLAGDVHNISNDEAQFHLGLYHWTKNDIEKAQQIWQPLIELAKTDNKNSSVWAQYAQMKLAQIA
jgi:tetratricopeptide (TPR) repeat protein